MAHYAVLDENNVVIQVTVGKDEGETFEGQTIDWEQHYRGKRTSYNTHGGVHQLGGTPFRKNYAGVGYTYDAQRDAFIPPQPFPSWTLNEDTCRWDAPAPYPTDGERYQWDEPTTSWVAVPTE